MISKLVDWYGMPAVYGFFTVVLVLAGAGLLLYTGTDEAAPEQTPESVVTLATVASLASAQTLEFIGSAEAIDETTITTEASGRVTRVNVSLGDSVRAGTVIAELENASERAAVLQAEGAYESALAAAAQGNVGVAEAENMVRAAQNSAVTAFRNAHNAFRNILRNDVDMLFTDPNGRVPGLRIDGGGQTAYLNSERTMFQSVLTDWQQRIERVTAGADMPGELAYASTQLSRLAQMIDTLIDQVNDKDSAGVFTQPELEAISSTLSSDRANINAMLGSIDSAETELENARESVTRAELGGTSSDLSTANAQVKQALGSLRAAQANLEKAILRTSIAGTVNSLSVKTGDFVGMSEAVARVANNDALEVTTFISESNRNRIAVGDTVIIDRTHDGIITNIAPAIDPATKKFEVKIGVATDEIANGDTLRIQFTPSEGSVPERLSIPITALKVETDRIVVFTVDANGSLEAREVTEGPLLGTHIIIEEGLTPDMEIVVDARGLNAGDLVTIRE